MRNKIGFMAVVMSAALLVGCSLPGAEESQEMLWEEEDNGSGGNMAGEGGKTPSEAADVSDEGEKMPSEAVDVSDEENNRSDEMTGETRCIEGYVLADGQPSPVKVTISLEGIESGEQAADSLTNQNSEIPIPEAGYEYIIFSFQISYDEGDPAEIDMMYNKASQQEASLYFALSNGDSNAEEMTDYLNDSIYSLTIAKGQSAHGRVAFLHRPDASEPICFVGFGSSAAFSFPMH